MTMAVVCPLAEADLDEVLALNQAHVPHVGALTSDRLGSIVDECTLALVARDEDELCGFVLVLGPGSSYDSPNYVWFSHRYTAFSYVDRIAISSGEHRRGLGRRLYTEVFEHARRNHMSIVAAEVNVRPPNPVSSAFHASMGFEEVARQDTYGGSVTVALMVAGT